MTEEQKREIFRLRDEGLKYREIADKMNMSQSAVKSAGRRFIKKNAQPCKNCGRIVLQPAGTRKKLFCSDKCRNQWWSKHKEEINHKAYYDFVCLNCGKKFRAYGNDHRKYCSHECYIKDRFGE